MRAFTARLLRRLAMFCNLAAKNLEGPKPDEFPYGYDGA